MPREAERLSETYGEGGPPRPPAKKAKKKGGKMAFLFLLLLLAGGAAAGLHAAGRWDARPLMYKAIPAIPWVGKDLASALGIPAEYSLTAEQRRALELRQWNDRLNEWERELEEKEARLDILSTDLANRAAAVKKTEEEQASLRPGLAENPEEEDEYLDMLMKTYQDISPRRAALIMEQLREDLAIKLLERMPQDARASILGRMEAAMAARLTERLATPGSR
ncbi:MAG: MgtE intracellular region [Synergistaceae bacterium]|nr:MgtE intracellular region [Synergistaceae bacterium]